MTLRADLADPGRRKSARIVLVRAVESGGARRAHGLALVDWMLAAAEGNSLTQPPVDRYALPTIMVEPDGLPRMIGYLESALADARLGLFWQSGRLVCVSPQEDPGGAESIRVFDVSEDLLADLGTQAAVWEVPGRENSANAKVVNCPRHVARGLLARRGMAMNVGMRGVGARLQPLTAVASSPTLRPDGSLLDLPGYDPATGLYLAFGETAFPEIPDLPTFDQAADALQYLTALLDEVAFIEGPSRAVALSAILTAIVRPSLPAAPMHAVTATTFGTGKSYLTDLVACVATGRTASPIAAGASDDEFEKRLGAALMAGSQIIVIDNVTRPVNGDLLNQVLTQERVSPRRLGKSEVVEIHCTAALLMNGNNLQIPADMTRRVLLCSLDARTEQPESREFASDPLAMIRADRGPYVAAALTILRAYIAAGRPNAPRALGSFEAWSNLVRGALLWLGEADPVKSMEAVRAADPHRQHMATIMALWDDAIGNSRKTIAEVIAAAVPSPEFREALLAVAGEHGAISGIRLGKFLGRNRGRIFDGRSFEPGAQRRGVATWTLTGAREHATSATVHDLTALIA